MSVACVDKNVTRRGVVRNEEKKNNVLYRRFPLPRLLVGTESIIYSRENRMKKLYRNKKR